MAPHISSRVPKIISNPHFWIVLALFAIVIVLHYPQQILNTDSPSLFSFLGLTRHALERVLFLLPVTYAGFVFGMRAGLASLAVALVVMLPRIFLISLYLPDALLETCCIIVIGGVVNLLLQVYRREKERYQQALSKVEIAQQELRELQNNYKDLFEGAYDAIWVHDLNGKIQIANKATEGLTGYSVKELCKKNVKLFLSEGSLNLARQVRRKLLKHQDIELPYEQRIIRRDGTEAICMLTTDLVISDGKPKAFHNIARDVTAERRMQENLRYYLQQITTAQEEERRRIALELHDDTAQDLVILLREIDKFISATHFSPQEIKHLEKLRQQTDRILDGVHRFSQDLRPSVLDDLGLLPALEWLTSDLTKHFGIAIDMEVLGSVRRFTPEIELVLFRIAQEALRNIWKHSEASKAWVTLKFGDDKTVLTVKDNGKGFELTERIDDLTAAGKLGLAGMQERAQLIGGKLTLKSELGKGTTVTAEIPTGTS